VSNSSFYQLYVALNGDWGPGSATIFLDNMRVVSELEPLPGDFNGDGVVDAADYTVWRDTLGSTTDLRADANLNGIVDSGDYQMWVANYGTTASAGSGASSAAVPEPSSAILGFLALGLILVSRRR
jgi:hypothetical protein